ncbi:MAG: phenylalanine--tRNA ligase subunit beta [Clostridia bacterium]|nr:phenylalanine--tRNA ligase subunit beta [Clostridia bacterium]
MKASMTFINDYVNIKDIDPKTFSDEMTMSGTKVEGYENLGEEINNVVVGKILSVEKHPDADKLVVCMVDVGKETIQIVTGAPNVFEGALVPVALHKSNLPGGVKITKGKLRGVESCGMFCSHEELGMNISDYEGACEDGVIIFKEDIAPGTDVKEALSLDENIIEFEITPNRADCYSVLGLAREAAVTFGRPLEIKKPKVTGNSEKASDYASIEVEDTKLCPRYAARIVKNVKIGPSPKWFRDRLKGCGIRSINNVVDITNFLLMEYGQPMHAFDLSYLEDSKIVVRRAKDGEKITTLDGVGRNLDSSMLVIADSKKPVAVAGVMGGENSEIKEDTKTLLFECANFDGASVRVTAKKLGLRTEASAHYEKGLDPYMIEDAVNRACELIEELGAGEVVGGIIDVNNAPADNRRITFNPAEINAFLGCEIDKEFMVKTLTDLEFKFDGDKVIPPTYRADVEAMADIAEEVARFYGYNNIPTTLLRGESKPGGRNAKQLAKSKIKNALVALGMYEINTYSFISPKMFDLIRLPADSKKRNVVKILNPLGEENSVMRTTLIGSMMDILTNNKNHRNASAKLFEMGNIYIPTTPDKLPIEKEKVAIGMYGNVDFYDIKGAVDDLADCIGLSGLRYETAVDNPSFHPGRCAKITIGGEVLGLVGEIHPEVAKNYDFTERAYVAELDFETILANINTEKTYKEMPKFPAVTRDIAVIMDEKTPVADMEDVIKGVCKNLLEELTLFDVYKGNQIEEGKKSVAYSLTLRSAEGTLAEEQITAMMEKIVKMLSEKLGASLR